MNNAEQVLNEPAVADKNRDGASGASQQLNEAQQQVAEHRGNHILVVAGAGTGKTRTLAARISSLLSEGADPNRILLLTFTRRAAEEMQRRVSAFTDSSSKQIWSGTFHAIGNRLLRHYGSAADLPDNFTVLDFGDTTDLFNMARSEEGFGQQGKRFPKAETVASIYSRSVNGQQKLSEVLQNDYPWCAQYQEELTQIFKAYTAHKRHNNVLDYDDLLLYWRGLTASPVGEALRCLFDHILVDEYQDTNAIQADIVKQMCGDTTTVCAVGDDAQAIYGFRSATAANMWSFTEKYVDSKLIKLEQNYRSTIPILELANEVLKDDAAGTEIHPKQLWSNKTSNLRPSLLHCSDEGEQSKTIADRILSTRERGIDLRSQAVLFRTGHHSDGLELELVNRDIPYVKYGGLKYLEAAHVKDLLALLRVLENPGDQLAWNRIFLGLEGVGPATASRLIKELRIDKTSTDVMTRFVGGIGSVPTSAAEQIDELRSAISDCLDETQELAPQIDRLKQFCAEIFPSKYENFEARLADIDQLTATAGRYNSRSRFLTELTLDPPERTGDLADKPHLDDDWLTLSTIHSAKGCEWESVYLIHAADGNIPSDMSLSDNEGVAEELRLLYVALTRAKRELTVSFPLRYHVNRFSNDDRHHFAQLSRFIDPVKHLFEQQIVEPAEEEPQAVDLRAVGAAEEVDQFLQNLWE